MPSLPHSSPAFSIKSSNTLWLVIYVIFIIYFMFQSVFFAQGYSPFNDTAYVAYPYRSMLAGFLFFFPLLWLIPDRWRDSFGSAILGFFVVATILYLGVVVCRRPDLVVINDRAEALSLGIRSVMNGRFPYLAHTHLGNSLSPLTASFLLALPAELIFGRPELMNIAFLFVLLGMLAFRCHHNRALIPFQLVCVLIVLNPIIVWELIWGSDLMWGSVLLLMALMLLESAHQKWASFVFGLALCTRLSFALLAPMLFVYLLRRDRAQGLRAVALILGTIVILELPLIIWDPVTFFNVAPIGLSNGKFSLPMPTHDNLFADLINGLHISLGARKNVITGGLLLLSTWLGWRKSIDLTQLSIHFSMIFALSLFLIGPFFLRDYLVWIFIPLLYGITAPGVARTVLKT